MQYVPPYSALEFSYGRTESPVVFHRMTPKTCTVFPGFFQAVSDDIPVILKRSPPENPVITHMMKENNRKAGTIP
jgi:hypothetical protein